MRIIADQPLPTDLGSLRKFVDQATSLVDADMTSYVSYYDGVLRVTAVREIE